ncbi:glycosyltransferase [Psychrobacter urativorans]|uniref:Glycosyl transferase family 1 n=1 Tax=Psychrobacter urativorans TaxID=45610 RepID=A0A0M4SWI5_9GAMM|nr:glycosyltransferase [Psychrobacter urativorans]ALF59160.1 hypothetical protein AOC03_03105 [Psychrobacter urativorans]
MNIMHIISAPASGGAEVYVKDMAKILAAEGHNVHIVFLSTAADAGRDVKYAEKFISDLKSSGIMTYIIGNETRKKPWLGVARLRKYIIKNNIDICHSHLAYGIVFSALSRVPVVYTHHTIKPRWDKLTYTIFNSLVDEYVGISKNCAEALSLYTGRKVNTILNAVSEEKFVGYVRTRKLEDTVKIAMVGQLTIPKDYITMLQALTLLDIDVQEKIKVLIAGEGDAKYKGELLDYIKENNLNHIVDFVGLKTNIPKFLYEADMFLLSSSSEGLPIALLEASISGLPCIVTDVGGCAEIIESSKNGVTVPHHNPQEIANEIAKFVLDNTLIERFSTNAINNAHKYSINKAAQLHIELYNSILK